MSDKMSREQEKGELRGVNLFGSPCKYPGAMVESALSDFSASCTS